MVWVIRHKEQDGISVHVKPESATCVFHTMDGLNNGGNMACKGES